MPGFFRLLLVLAIGEWLLKPPFYINFGNIRADASRATATLKINDHDKGIEEPLFERDKMENAL